MSFLECLGILFVLNILFIIVLYKTMISRRQVTYLPFHGFEGYFWPFFLGILD